MTPLLLLGIRLTAVVDRVEGPMAVVEWRSDTLADLPLALLPPDVGEGDRLLLRIGLHRRGAWLAVGEQRALLLASGRPMTLDIPVQPGLRVGQRYALRVRRSQVRPQLGGASALRVLRAGTSTQPGVSHDADG